MIFLIYEMLTPYLLYFNKYLIAKSGLAEYLTSVFITAVKRLIFLIALITRLIILIAR